MSSDPIAIADEIVYNEDWNLQSADEFHPEIKLNVLHNRITAAIRDAYERAAGVAEHAQYNGAEIRERDNSDEYYAEAGHEQARRDIALAIRALRGEAPMTSAAKREANIHEIRFDVWCGCGKLISIYGDKDGTIFHVCGACDKLAFKGTWTLEMIDAEDLEDEE